MHHRKSGAQVVRVVAFLLSLLYLSSSQVWAKGSCATLLADLRRAHAADPFLGVIEAILPQDHPAPYPKQVLEWRDQVDQVFGELDYGAFSSADLKSAFLEGRAFSEVFVITHLLRNYQSHGAAFLEQPEYRRVPRLFLASPSFPIVDPEWLGEASVVELSNGGEFVRKLNADRVHVAGGDFFGCLRNTVFDVIDHTLSYAERNKVTVLFHSELIYDGGHRLDWAARPSHSAARVEAEDYLHNRENPGEPIYLTGSFEDAEGYHYEFVRGSDRKQIELIATFPQSMSSDIQVPIRRPDGP